MPDIRIQITDFLKTHGPAKPREILDKIGGKASALNRVLGSMLEDGELNAVGVTRSRTYGLKGQTLSGTVGAPKKKKPRRPPAKKKRTAHRARRTTPRAAKPAPICEAFLASITADHRLVINHGAASPQVFSPEHTREIADIAFANFTQ